MVRFDRRPRRSRHGRPHEEQDHAEIQDEVPRQELASLRYEAALRKRGDITFWFDEEAIDAWRGPRSGRPGGQHRYSDRAIVTVLTLRAVFHLPLRQSEGFVASLVTLMGLDLETPDHTTLSGRRAPVEVPRLVNAHEGPIHLAVDSTGLKIMGDGEWHAHQHKTSNKRRAWRQAPPWR
ncbi:MAG: hypothetical protein ACI9WU_001658 [Myxococcota bacterium]|jgi:hypothetical protein